VREESGKNVFILHFFGNYEKNSCLFRESLFLIPADHQPDVVTNNESIDIYCL
jgi:hypothetical protein